jgi:2-polyprenyl-6-methoxyphenol hydroxylase-like FAD-dependent oxidoreductase
VVIAADGLHSAARHQLVGDAEVNSGYVAYRAAIPIEQARRSGVAVPTADGAVDWPALEAMALAMIELGVSVLAVPGTARLPAYPVSSAAQPRVARAGRGYFSIRLRRAG